MLFKWFFFLHWIAIYVVCNIHMYPPLEWQTLLWDKLVNMLPGYNWLELKTIEFNCPTAIFKLIRIENTLSWSFAVRMHHSSAYSAYRHILSDVETRKKSTTVIQYVYIYHHGLYHDAVNPFQENLKPQLLQISRTIRFMPSILKWFSIVFLTCSFYHILQKQKTSKIISHDVPITVDE